MVLLSFIVINYVSLLLLIILPNGCESQVGGQFDEMFSSMTKGSKDMKTEHDEEGRAQLHVRTVTSTNLLA